MEIKAEPQAKKEWKTPELIVLLRSKLEEAVLVSCKIELFSNTPGHGVFGCTFPHFLECYECSTIFNS